MRTKIVQDPGASYWELKSHGSVWVKSGPDSVQGREARQVLSHTKPVLSLKQPNCTIHQPHARFQYLPIHMGNILHHLHTHQLLESVHMVLTQPGTPVSFWGMCIYLLFNFWKVRNFRCFPFPENSGTLTFLISGNSGLRRFLLLVIHSCISPFTCDSVVPPCFMYYSHLCTQVFPLYLVHTCPTP